MGTSRLSKTALIGYMLAIIGALLFLLSGYGYQWGWWGLGTAFRTIIPLGSLIASIGLILSLAGLYICWPGKGRKGFYYAVIGVIFGALTVGSLGYWYSEMQKGYPPIHDISTDTQNPPAFKAILPLRADAPNKSEYGGEKIARIQHEYYPDITTLRLNVSPAEAYDKALAAAKRTSWVIVAANKKDLRIEATHTLPWFGFKDDVVIRVDTTQTGSKIDVRSVSRVGRGDIGVNAERIRDYLADIKAHN